MSDPQLVLAFALAVVTLALAAWSFERYRLRQKAARWISDPMRPEPKSSSEWERVCSASLNASRRRRGLVG